MHKSGFYLCAYPVDFPARSGCQNPADLLDMLRCAQDGYEAPSSFSPIHRASCLSNAELKQEYCGYSGRPVCNKMPVEGVAARSEVMGMKRKRPEVAAIEIIETPARAEP
jgi:hypothetical protein